MFIDSGASFETVVPEILESVTTTIISAMDDSSDRTASSEKERMARPFADRNKILLCASLKLHSDIEREVRPLDRKRHLRFPYRELLSSDKI